MSQQNTERVEPFAYPAGAEPVFPCREGLNFAEEDTAGRARPVSVPAAVDEGTAREAAERALRSVEAAHARGVEEGRLMEREALAGERQANERQFAIELATRFGEERDRFFHRAEQEVVKLALAVASRVLRREAQADPLLLTGAVRVALGQLSDSTETRLRVPAGDLDLWLETVAHLPGLAFKPAVVADDTMQAGDCLIESAMGSADLGTGAQLLEIDRSLFDGAERKFAAEAEVDTKVRMEDNA